MSLAKTILSILKPIETEPSDVKTKLRHLNGIKAVVFDVYGTLLTNKAGGNSLAEPSIESDKAIIDALIDTDFDVYDHKFPFSKMYTDHIQAHYDIRRAEGITYPEINIADVWQDFLNELFANNVIDGDMTDRSIQRLIVRHECKVNPVWSMKGSLEAIRSLQDHNIALGTISTAQFYTPITMETLYQNSLETLGFKKPICIWSYEHRHRKPSAIMFQLCLAGLKVLKIEPNEALYVGNDVFNDILPAQKFGMKTALFVGDKTSTRLHEDDEESKKVKPNIIFNDFKQLTNCIL